MSTEEQKPPTGEQIPLIVGDLRVGYFQVNRKSTLGCGNFGSVFPGYSTTDPTLEVAIKYETAHNGTYAKREWAIMKSLRGCGVPRVHWTGAVGEFHVMVMDRLGKSLQQVCDSRQVRVLSVSETRALGMKCVELLRAIHEAGVVHGDVKPENFLLGYKPAASGEPGTPRVKKPVAVPANARNGTNASPRGVAKRRKTRDETDDVTGGSGGVVDLTGAALPADGDEAEESFVTMDLEHAINRYGLYLVDLGLGLHWARKDMFGEPILSSHVPYKQRIDHFSGTVRYSSVNVHVGRYATRRDDLESLLYMLIFLHRGSLPWQGFSGNGKEMLVCRKKGSMSVVDVCRGCPEEMKYLLAYVRELKYDQRPDYDYILSLMDFGKGRGLVRKWMLEDVSEREGATTPGGTGGGSGGGVPDSSTPVPFSPVSPSTDPTRLGSANKRKRDGEASPGSTGAGGAGGMPGRAGSPMSLAQSAASGGSTKGTGMNASGTRPTVVVPRTEAEQSKCWIVVNTSSEGDFRRPSGQTVTMHTCWENLVKKIKEFWDMDKKVSQICFDGGMWSGIFDDEGTGYLEQTVHHSPGKEFPGEWVRLKWEEGYMITSVAASDSGWGIVASKMSRKRSYEQQSYMATSTFPSKWIAEKWAVGFMVTSVACYKSPRPFWVVVMSSGTRFTEQAVELDYKYPSESIRARWGEGMMITSHAASVDQIVFVLSKYAGSDMERQHCIRTPTGPIAKVEEDWKEGLYLTGLAYGRVV